MENKIKLIAAAILKKMNGSDVCELTFKKCGETVTIKYQGNDLFYANRNENWYMGQPLKCYHWVTTSTLIELAEWIAKYC